MAQLAPVTFPDGTPVRALGILPGSVTPGCPLLKRCSCGAYVAWVRSRKSGRWYLADTQRSNSERAGRLALYVTAFHAHHCSEGRVG